MVVVLVVMVGVGVVAESQATRCWEGGHIVDWYNTGQEESILLTVKIHLVRNKRSQRPECSNWPHLASAP